MSALSSLLLRGLLGQARWVLVRRAQVLWKLEWEKVGVMESVIRLIAYFICFLVPLAWVLSHLESYKKWE